MGSLSSRIHQLRNSFKGIGLKMLLLTFLPIFLLGCVGIVSYTNINGLGNKLDVLLGNTVPAVSTSSEITSHFNNIESSILGSIYYSKNSEISGEYISNFQNSFDKVKSSIELYSSFEMPNKAINLRRELQQKWNLILPILMRVDSDLSSNKFQDVEAIYTSELKKRIFEVKELLSAIELNNVDIIEAYKADSTKKTKLIIIFGSLIASVISLGLSFVISNNIRSNLVSLSDQLYQSSNDLLSISQNLETGMKNVNQGAQTSASSLEETASSVEELTSMVKNNDNSVQQANSVTSKLSNLAEISEKEINKLITSMSSISESSKKINEILSLIDDISFQTNLLALNAAVEAARAGEQGKGFAVVAEAVRGLAQRSALAAKEISELISQSTNLIQNGVKTADQSGQTLKSMVVSISEVSILNHSIAEASDNQSTGLSQISLAMNQIDHINQENVNVVSSIVDESKLLTNQSGKIKEIVEQLNEIVKGR